MYKDSATNCSNVFGGQPVLMRNKDHFKWRLKPSEAMTLDLKYSPGTDHKQVLDQLKHKRSWLLSVRGKSEVCRDGQEEPEGAAMFIPTPRSNRDMMYKSKIFTVIVS